MSQGDVCVRQRELWSVFVSGSVHYKCCLVQDLNQHRILPMQQLTFPYIIQIVPLEMITQYDGIVVVFHKHFQKGG